MTDCREALPEQVRRFGVDTGLFFLLYFLYLWLVIDPRLVHHAIGILTPYHALSFTTGWPFFREQLAAPGGIAGYAARFLSALFHFGWLGAAIVTAAAWAMCSGIDTLTRLAGRPRDMVIRYVPAVLLLVIYGRYSQPLIAILSLLTVLACFVVYLRVTPQSTAKAVALVVLLCMAAYYVAGAPGLLFPVLVGIYEILIKRRTLAGMAALLSGLAVPWLLSQLLYQLASNRSDAGFPAAELDALARGSRVVLLLYLYFPAVLIGVAGYRELRNRRALARPGAASRKRISPRDQKVARFLWRGESRWSMQVAAVCLAAGGIAWFSFQTRGKTFLQTDYYCQRGMWPEVLEAADRMPQEAYSASCNRNVTLALYHTGRLGDDLFRYRQTMGVDFYDFSDRHDDVHTFLQQSQLFLELGEVNRAERCAAEALQGTGDLPVILERLAIINIVKDRPETARVFLHALSKKLLYHRTATNLLQRLEEDPRLESDARIGELRRGMLRRDNVRLGPGIEASLLRLLQENPHNRMAFEFLMVHFLCTARPGQVVASLQQWQDPGYRRVPRHFQEAMVVHAGATDGRLPSTPHPLDPDVLSRAVMLDRIRATTADEEQAAWKAIAAGLGDSYLFFYTYGTSGL